MNTSSAVSWPLVIALLMASASVRAELVTIVAKGHVSDIVNEHRVNGTSHGPAVDPVDVPFAVGDEMTILFTYESSTAHNGGEPPSYNDCSAWHFTDAIQEASFTVGGTAGTMRTSTFGYPNNMGLVDCQADSAIPADVVHLGGYSLAPNIADLPATDFGLSQQTDVDCLNSADYLPAAASDLVIRCQRTDVNPNGPNGMTVSWATFDGDFDVARVIRAIAREFTFSEPTTADFADQLVAEVFALNLKAGIQNALDAKIDAAVAAAIGVDELRYAVGSNQQLAAKLNAHDKMNAFVNQVEAQRGKAITSAQADRLVLLANRLSARL